MLEIGLDQLSGRLAGDNPWWDLRPGAGVRLRQLPRRAYYAGFLDKVLEPKADKPLLLAGPPRAGKTVLLRQALADCVRRGVPPARVMFAPLSAPVYAGAPLADLVRIFQDKVPAGVHQRWYLFLDEAPFLSNWEKQLLDVQKAFPAVRIVAGLSSGVPDFVSGKTDGTMETYVLPPLTFLEYLRFRGRETILSRDGDGEKPGFRLSLGAAALRDLNREFIQYVNLGGFPEGVVPAAGGPGDPKAPPPPLDAGFIRDQLIDRVLHKDHAGLHGVSDTQGLIRLFVTLARNTGGELAYEELARKLDLAKNTLRKYLDYLERAFLIRRVVRVDKYAGRFQRQVAFKVYLTSASLHAALFGVTGPDEPAFPRLAETAIVGQWLGSGVAARLAYASWKGGRVDLMTMDAGSGRPAYVYEMDWGDGYAKSRSGPEELVSFVERTNIHARAYVLTSSLARPGKMRRTGVTLIPAAVYAYWLGRRRLLG